MISKCFTTSKCRLISLSWTSRFTVSITLASNFSFKNLARPQVSAYLRFCVAIISLLLKPELKGKMSISSISIDKPPYLTCYHCLSKVGRFLDRFYWLEVVDVSLQLLRQISSKKNIGYIEDFSQTLMSLIEQFFWDHRNFISYVIHINTRNTNGCKNQNTWFIWWITIIQKPFGNLLMIDEWS